MGKVGPARGSRARPAARERASPVPSGSETSPAPHRARGPRSRRECGTAARSEPKKHSPNHVASKTPPRLAAGLSVPSAARGRRYRHREQGGPSLPRGHKRLQDLPWSPSDRNEQGRQMFGPGGELHR